MDLNNKTIIIGFADALSAPEVAYSLIEAGFRVAAFSRRKSKPPALRKCKAIEILEVTAPEEDVRSTVNELGSIYRSLQAAAIMPLNDKAVWLCNKLSIDHEIQIVGAKGAQAQFALDKRQQTAAARNAGFNVPRSVIIESIEDIDKVTDFPVIVKPAMVVAEDEHRFLKNASLIYCISKQEFDKAMTSWNGRQPLLAQDVHEGVGEGLFGFVTGTDVIAWSAHRRVRMMNPKGSGSSACRAMPLLDYPVKEAKEMLLRINWRGIFMIELLRDARGKSWFMELNGRPWGSMALARRMGFEYPSWAVMQTLDPSFLPVIPVQREYVTCRHLGMELVHLLYVLRGPSSAAIPNWPSFWRTLADLMKISKNDRWYNWQSNNKTLFLKDTYDTLMNETLRKFIK